MKTFVFAACVILLMFSIIFLYLLFFGVVTPLYYDSCVLLTVFIAIVAGIFAPMIFVEAI